MKPESGEKRVARRKGKDVIRDPRTARGRTGRSDERVHREMYAAIISRYDRAMITMLMGEMAVGNFGTAITLSGTATTDSAATTDGKSATGKATATGNARRSPRNDRLWTAR